ncbi:MAG: hypothetical protein ABR961_07320 [Thermoanaerobaculaceae bacterium]
MMRHALSVAVLLAGATSASAQEPSADWRTFETPHFRIHYTAPAEAWALHATARLEAVRDRVIAEVGYAPPQVVDVVVSDPIAQANGMALPLLVSPRMVLWTSPPGPASGIGFYTDWTELLTVHEETHLVHLLRPSRNPVQRLAEALLPVGPIALKAPRWVDEGYATLVEGKLTGSGRPNGDLRAAILRHRARAGALPTYEQMASDSQSWLGMSMAYLAGSAYLEWLVERSGPESLKHLWARMTARESRSFGAAFEGVFGEPPARLYERFCAELTWRAVEAERRLGPTAVEGEVWQKLAWTTGEPAVSGDAKKLALVVRDRTRPSRLVVWSTGEDDEGERKWKARIEGQLKRDPEDVAPVRAQPLPRKPLRELVTRNGAEPFTPRFLRDGKTILFVRFETDPEGFLHPDLFRWETEAGGVHRITRFADVREADPSPDGAWAVGVRNRHGLSQLVKVDLATGAVSEVTQPSVDVVCAQPRVSPDGTTVAFVRHEGGAWKLVLRELVGGREIVLPSPDGATVAYPAWGAGGKAVFASLGTQGFIDVVSWPVGGTGAPAAVTRTTGAALAPAPTPEGSAVYFLALNADGLDLRRLELPVSPAPEARPSLADLAPAARPVAPPPPPPLAATEVAASRAYGLGRQEPAVIVGGSAAPSASAWELGARLGDVVGRLDVAAIVGGGGGAGPRGGTLAAAWRGWPVTVSLQLFGTRERPSEQPTSVPGIGTALDVDRSGGEISASWQRSWDTGGLEVGGGALLGRLDPVGGDSLDRHVGFATVRATNTPSIGQWSFPHLIEARLEAGRTGDDSWRRYGGRFEVGVMREGDGLLLSFQRNAVRDATSPLERVQLGGVDGSLLPESALAGRIAVPALPVGTLMGDEHEGERATMTLGGLPLFFERHRVWDRDGSMGDWLRLTGLEWDLASGPVPLVKMPGFHLTLGVARILDEPLDDRTEWWLALAWRP